MIANYNFIFQKTEIKTKESKTKKEEAEEKITATDKKVDLT